MVGNLCRRIEYFINDRTSWRWKFYIHEAYWVWPQRNFRMNSSFQWGCCSPYVSYRFGPFEVRRYETL